MTWRLLQGWDALVINNLSKDLTKSFPDDSGYSERNLRNMKRFALRGITQPLGIAQYETKKLFEDMASGLLQIGDFEDDMKDNQED